MERPAGIENDGSPSNSTHASCMRRRTGATMGLGEKRLPCGAFRVSIEFRPARFPAHLIVALLMRRSCLRYNVRQYINAGAAPDRNPSPHVDGPPDLKEEHPDDECGGR